MHPEFNSANLVGRALTSWREMRGVEARGALLCLLGHMCQNWGMRGEGCGVSTGETFCGADLLSVEASLPI